MTYLGLTGIFAVFAAVGWQCVKTTLLQTEAVHLYAQPQFSYELALNYLMPSSAHFIVD